MRQVSRDSFLLEGKLERHLHQPRLSGPDYLAEERAVDIGIHGRGSKKLCMIESIERFDPHCNARDSENEKDFNIAKSKFNIPGP